MPSRSRLKSWILAGTAAIAVLLPCLASATLGEPEASVLSDGAQLQGSVKESDLGSYRLHEIQLLSGTVVREYAGLDGTVFAITWHGPSCAEFAADSRPLFRRLRGGGTDPHADHHHLQVKQVDLVVEASGHMRAFNGRAYLPQAIPAGVSVGELP